MSELVVWDSVKSTGVVKDFLEVGKSGKNGFMGVSCDRGVWVANYDVGVFALGGVFVELEVDVGSCDRGWSRWIVSMFSLGWEGVFPVFGRIGHGVKGGCGVCFLEDKDVTCS